MLTFCKSARILLFICRIFGHMTKQYYQLFLVLIGLFLVSFSFQALFTQTGVASYYAAKFHGRKTSSGKIYHKDSLSAAHRSLKFGTKLKVTNLSNDSVVFVVVTDRMASKAHILDLSYAGAVKLNMVRSGVAKVRIEEVQ